MKEAEEEKRFEEVMRKESTREIVMRKESAKEIVMRKESAKEIEDIFGAGKDGNSRCSKKGGRNTEEGASFSNGSRTGRIVGNRGEHLEGIPMSSRIAQNLTTPRGHGRRDGETKQVEFSIILYIFLSSLKVIHMLILIMCVSSPPQSSSL